MDVPLTILTLEIYPPNSVLPVSNIEAPIVTSLCKVSVAPDTLLNVPIRLPSRYSDKLLPDLATAI